MTTFSRLKILFIFLVVFALPAVSYAQAEEYEWLKSQNCKTIFVFTDFNGCDFIADKLNETVVRTFSRSDIKATISSSMAFKTTNDGFKPMGGGKDPVYELLDEELTANGKILLHIYGKCIRYTSGYIYQFDIHFGVNNQKYSQALLYSTPHHSVVGVDTAMGIDRAFRELMKKAVDDYLSVNQQ